MKIVSLILLASVLLAHADINVTNYGALGDTLSLPSVVCVSNSPIITCAGASFVSTDVNKLVEVFGGGEATFTNGVYVTNQTLITYIQAVNSATSVTLVSNAWHTATLNGFYGTDSAVGFSNAIAAAALPTDNIIIPAGTYLMAPRQAIYGYPGGFGHKASIPVWRGGLNFVGQGTAILQETGWRTAGSEGERGALFGFTSPVTNNYPLVWSNLMFYGGEPQGNNHSRNIQPSNPWDGNGWDESHHAIVFGGGSPEQTAFVDSLRIVNCTCHGWRGEMIINGIGNPYTTQTYLTASNNFFYDGNGTAFNIYVPHDYNHNVFSNLLEVEEFFPSLQPTNSPSSQFRNNLVTGCYNGFAQQSGWWFSPMYYYTNNTFTNMGGYVFLASNYPNWVFANNTVNANNGLGIGSAGGIHQTTWPNSNIVIANNQFIGNGGGYPVTIEDAGDDRTCNLKFFSNSVVNWSGMIQQWGGGVLTNGLAAYNTCDSFFGEQQNTAGQYFLDQTNSYRLWGVGGNTSITNFTANYGRGSLQSLNGNWFPQNLALDNGYPLMIPSGATLTITNADTHTNAIYENASFTGTPVSIVPNQALTFLWNGTDWQQPNGGNGQSPPGAAAEMFIGVTY